MPVSDGNSSDRAASFEGPPPPDPDEIDEWEGEVAESPAYSGPQFTLSTLLKGVTGIACCFGLLKTLPFFGIAGLLAIAPMFILRRPVPRPHGAPRAAWPIAGLLLGLASWALGLVSPAVPILWIVLAARRSYVGMALLALACPVGIPTIFAVVSYFRGDATIDSVGDPGPEYYNIDREYRCRRVSSGVRYTGNEWLRHPPHNQVVKLLIDTFGPMRGSYTGPYPERYEAVATAKESEPLDPAQIQAEVITVAGKPTRITPDTARRLTRLGMFEIRRANAFPSAPPPIPLAGIWNDRCLVIWIPSRPAPYIQPAPVGTGGVVVIDRETGLCFAVFDFHSDLMSLRDTVNWGIVEE